MEAKGANCAECPLRQQSVDGFAVGCSKASGTSRLVLLLDQPSATEQREGKLLEGQTGWTLENNLKARNIPRSDIHVTSVLCCHPKHKLKPKEWRKAVECCAPRLEKELKNQKARTIFACGTKALYSLSGKAVVKDAVGTPMEGKLGSETFKYITCFRPEALYSKPALEPVFRIWLDRVWRLACGKLKPWVWPETIVNESSRMKEALQEMLDSGSPIGVDIETTGIDTRTCAITCIGFANDSCAVSVPWPSSDSNITRLSLELLGSNAVPKTFQNGYGFDIKVFNSQEIEVNGFDFDTLLAHCVAGSQLPHHDLEFISAVEFHCPRWKTSFKTGREGSIWEDETYAQELRVYNARDAYLTHLLRQRLTERLATVHQGWELFQEQMSLANLAMRMSERGIQLDKSKRSEHRKKIVAQLHNYKLAFNKVLESIPEVADKQIKFGKHGAHGDIKSLFYEHLGIKPTRFNEDTGTPVLDAAMLEELVANPDEKISMLARANLSYRRWYKLLSVYIDSKNIDIDSSYVVHANWSPHKAITGRWGCSKPNLMNIPKPKLRTNPDGTKDIITPGLRDLFCARPGLVLVAADYSQLELRLMALLSRAPLLLEWYNNGDDVHARTAEQCFGPSFTDKERNLAKTIEYGFNYNLSSDVTEVWKTLVLSHPKLTQRQVKLLRKKWFATHPEIRRWQWRQVESAKANGYVEEPFSGRREYFHDGRIDANKVLNYPFQASGATLMNRAALELDEMLDWDKEAILLQIHDDLTCETDRPDIIIPKIRAAMTQSLTLDGITMDFPVDISVGESWGRMEEQK